jgi:hypothetical protein
MKLNTAKTKVTSFSRRINTLTFNCVHFNTDIILKTWDFS